MSSKKQRIRINKFIVALKVRLVDPEGVIKGADGLPDASQLGIVQTRDAQALANKYGLDLVEVSPNVDPPVVRIMDFGKFQFDERKAKRKQRPQKLKELKFRPVTDDGDYKVKLRNLMGFIERGDKVKVTVRFKGREITHQELGMQLLERIKADVDNIAVVEQMPKMEGKQLIMVISPATKKGVAKNNKTSAAPVVATDVNAESENG